VLQLTKVQVVRLNS